MLKTNRNTRNLRSALLLGAASAAIGLILPASAQEAGGNVETVVVTGSRIPQQGLYSASPVTAVGQAELKLTGTTDVVNLLDQLPSIFVGQNSTSNNGSTGTSTINLRGLGTERTLVLVNGTRLMPGDPTLPAPDVNTIPASLVDHIEVLTGGASAVYGSDAVAGVVNFIMRKDFEGVELDSQYSVNQTGNNNDYAKSLYNAAGFTNAFTGAPVAGASGNVVDGAAEDATIIVGSNTENGKGNITAYLGYRHADPILEGTRAFSNCTLKDINGDTARGCAGSANYSLFISIDNYVFGNPATFFGTGNGKKGSGAFAPFTGAPSDYFNYGALNYLQRNDQRYNGGFFGHYEANKQLDIYSSFMFTDDSSTAQLAPTAVFAGDGPVSGAFNTVNCTNPYLTVQENQTICGLNPGDNLVKTGAIVTALGHPYWDGAGNLYPNEALMEIGRRNIEGGDRRYTTDHQAYRMQVGARGDFGDGWTYDVYGQYGFTTFAEDAQGQLSKSRVQSALQVDPLTGQCVSSETNPPTSSGCVGLNIFNGFGGITPSQLAYVAIPVLEQGSTEEQILSGSVTGDLGQWGIQSPWAKNPVAVSLGTEYREETLVLQPDAVSSELPNSDVEGAGGITDAEHGSFNVTEGFTEIKVPVIQNMPYIEDFTLNGGYRYSSYNTAGSTNTYKYGGEWQPIDDFRIRGSVQRAVRAPNILELFSPDSVALASGVQDPCSAAGNPTGAVAANCAKAPGNANVPAKAVGSALLNCIASQCNTLVGGNVLLKPETSITHSLGVVLTPTFLDGFTATVDYFDIQVGSAISTIPVSTTLLECYGATATAASQALFCPLVQRNPLTHAITGTGYVSGTNINTGSLGTTGFDFEANYTSDLNSWGLQNAGSLTFNLIGTLLDQLTVSPVPGLGTYDCAGLYGNTCSSNPSGAPNPRWRHKFRVTWQSPWDFSFSVAWRYFGEVSLDQNTAQPLLAGSYNAIESHIPAYNWFDLAGDWNISQGVSMRAGVNNVFDRDPPITAIQPLPQGQANTFPGSYDSLGRTIFVNATVKY